jgi:hypothetical protein
VIGERVDLSSSLKPPSDQEFHDDIDAFSSARIIAAVTMRAYRPTAVVAL